ncbi:MAG: hypothetical protein E2O66_05970 [Deltaproteobacteria bacterium]|nr:MAG: hypothetical protein E2O66_05970 [Deltaproteobacteria bacterium]
MAPPLEDGQEIVGLEARLACRHHHLLVEIGERIVGFQSEQHRMDEEHAGHGVGLQGLAHSDQGFSG